MSIDWFTTGAQIINFLILVWLLKKLLFKPIIGVMEHREQGLTSRLQQAETEMSKAELLKQEYEKHLEQLRIEKGQVLSQAKQQAETEKAEILQQLNDELQQKKNQFDAELRKQQQQLQPLISQTIAEKSLSLSRKTLASLADQDLEQRIIVHFLRYLSNLPNDEQTKIKQSLKDGSSVILTAFKPNIEMRQHLLTWFDDFAPGAKLKFEQRDYLLSGIALEVGGRSWEWNVDRFLSELGTELLK